MFNRVLSRSKRRLLPQADSISGLATKRLAPALMPKRTSSMSFQTVEEHGLGKRVLCLAFVQTNVHAPAQLVCVI
jgi:hypothetical protein